MKRERIYLCVLGILISGTLNAQSLRKDFKAVVDDRFTVNQPDQTVVAFTTPVKRRIKAAISKSYYWFAAHEIRSTQGGYSGKLLNGPYTAFYLSKNLKEQGLFSAGLKTGEWKSWYENGNLRELVNWKDGLKKGKSREYNEDGSIRLTGRYRDGKLVQQTRKDSSRVQDSTQRGKKKIKIQKWMRRFNKLNPFKRKNRSSASQTENDRTTSDVSQ